MFLIKILQLQSRKMTPSAFWRNFAKFICFLTKRKIFFGDLKYQENIIFTVETRQFFCIKNSQHYNS